MKHTFSDAVGEEDLLGGRVITDISKIEELLRCCNTQGCGSLCDVEKYRKGVIIRQTNTFILCDIISKFYQNLSSLGVQMGVYFSHEK